MERPKTRYARSGELAIAYQVHGSGDHDLLFSAGPYSNIGTVWQLPEAVRLYERLGHFARVIRYDRRDSGLSDPIKDDLTFEAHAQDALAVIEATRAQRPVLVGSLDGSRAFALLAAMAPEQVGGLIALAPTIGTAVPRSSAVADSLSRSMAHLDWPGPLLAVSAPRWASDPVRSDLLEQYLQTCATPRQARRAMRAALASDISQALPLVQAPTLVLRPRDLQIVAADAVRAFADLIPNATYREIPGDAALIYALDVELLADVIEEFVTGTAPVPPTNRVLATVMFTDLVASTQRAAQAGDRAWAAMLERHLAATRAAVSTHGGQTIATTGDGILALFGGPAQSVRCAQQVVADSRSLGLEVRTGVHTGEVERSNDDVAGIAVHLAARITSLAHAGEILVSRTVRDLVIGSELTFADRGEHDLKGIPDRWTIYAARA